jgi:hypothetical protein
MPSLATLNSVKAVLWDTGDIYPQLGADERMLITSWLNQAEAQRWFITGQDIGWDMSVTGTDPNPTWFQTYLHASFVRDDADGGTGTEGTRFQILATTHPISTGHGNQDLEQEIFGTNRFWPDEIINDRGGDVPPPWAYTRYTGGGNAAAISYQGSDYRLVYEAFAHCMIQDDGTWGTPGHVFGVDVDEDRAWIADSTIRWLMGGDHPDVTVTTPNGGQVWSGNQTITWAIANAASQEVQISRDGGQSFVVEATGLAGTATSYSWDTAKQSGGVPIYPNGETYRVKILAQSTNLKAFDISDADFTVDNGVAGDEIGPIIVAGSIKVNPLPGGQGNTITFDARADDRAKGNSNIAAAEYCIDLTTNPATAMSATDTTWDSKVEDITGTYVANIAIGSHVVFVRARDAAGNWGEYEQFTFQVNEGGPNVAVTAPNTPDTVLSGLVQITWAATDYTDAPATLDCTIEYSEDLGGTWTVIESGTNNNDGACSFDTGMLADGVAYLVRVSATDSYPQTGSDVCDYAFSVDNAPNDRWYMQVQQADGNRRLNMFPVDEGVHQTSTMGIDAAGSYLIGTWQTDPLPGGYIDGAWDFNVHGAMSAALPGTGNLYVRVLTAPGHELLSTTAFDDENVYSFSAPHLFSWTDTLSGNFTIGALRVELWVQVTATGGVGAGTQMYDLSGTHPHVAYRKDVNEAPYWTQNSQTDVTGQAALDASDNARYACADSGGGDYNVMEYQMKIGQPPHAITQVELHFEGYSTRSGLVNVYARDQTSGAWTFVAGGTTVSGTDSTFVGILSGVDWTRYVTGANNTFIWMAEDMTIDSVGMTTQLYVDYMKATVTWAVPAPAFSAYFDFFGSSSYIEPSLNLTTYSAWQNISVVVGWNLVSVGLVGPASMPGALVDKIGGVEWTRVMWYDPTDAADHWKQYNTGWSVALNDLKTIDNTMGIWLFVTELGDGEICVGGLGCREPSTTQIHLRAGWNMVGYPSKEMGLSAAESFWGTGTDAVECYDPGNQYHLRPMAAADSLVPGRGYWVHVATDSVWTVWW